MSNRSWNKRRATVEQIETGRRRWLGLRGWVVLALIGGGLIVGLWMAVGKTFSLSPDESVSAAHPPSRPPGNQLADAPSPYLREAARQPVHWLPWGQEAFRWAQEEDKPILLDIGAIWCHWCHVMDVESYENEDIAALINRDYVAIKVDRDERPDIDRRYQEAVQGLTGRGGWPLTAFLTPDGKVFFGGTYFPPDNRGRRPGLVTLLPSLAEAYKTRKAEVLASAEQLSTALTRRARQSVQAGTITGELVDAIVTQMAQRFDVVNGGFGTGTKFPAASAIELALARYFLDHDPKLLRIATKTLDAMAQGGVYDQIGGGFFRYSTDPQWRVPHFEKMSYDNAELLVNYLHTYQATGKALYREIAEGIIAFVNDVLSDQDNGGFYAHQDADMTREDDGDYYTWTVQEVRQALPREEAEVIQRYYDIQPRGEMRENPFKNVPFIASSPEAIATALSIPTARVQSLIDQGKTRLLQARTKRKTPLVDKTIYIDRNGMLISAYLEAFQALGDEQAKAFALKTLDLLLRKAYREGKGMYHAYSEGQARLPGLLDDQVQMAKALLDAFGVTGERRYLTISKDLMDYAITQLWDPTEGGFFDRQSQDEALAALERPFKDVEDNPSSSPNGVAALVLDRLAYLTNDGRYEKKALQTLRAFAGSAKGAGRFAATYALAVHYHLNRSAQVVIIGKKPDPQTQALWTAAIKTYRPGKLVAVYDPSELNVEDLPPAVAGAVKVFGVQGAPRAYVCAGSTCAPPTSDLDEVVALTKSYGLQN